MAARLKTHHQEDARAKIKTSQLINFLQDHAVDGKEVKDRTRITAAGILLNKVLPDLKAVEGDLNLYHHKHEEALEALE
jgi:hypothetical protein